MKQQFPYTKTFILGFGFLGISLIWPIFNNFVPIFLRDRFGLSATLIGFIMTWDNYLNMFIQPVVGERSDRTHTRLGRRKPWMLVGAPLAAVFFILVPTMGSVVGIMFAILLTNLSMALFRAPTIALLGDLFPSHQRSTANGIINLMGGLGAILAFVVGGLLYKLGRVTPFAFGSLVMLAAITLVILLVRETRLHKSKTKEAAFSRTWGRCCAPPTAPDCSSYWPSCAGSSATTRWRPGYPRLVSSAWESMRGACRCLPLGWP
jgi:maltose/moltooligosaccharide transporter